MPIQKWPVNQKAGGKVNEGGIGKVTDKCFNIAHHVIAKNLASYVILPN